MPTKDAGKEQGTVDLRSPKFARIPDNERHHSLDHPQEILRDALRALREDLSSDKILRIVERLGYKPPFGKKSLDNFVLNITNEIKPDHYEVLAEVWLRNAQGRSLRYVHPSALNEIDKLTMVLSCGEQLGPAGKIVDGRYFMYHGSYIAEDHYVIRVIDVKCTDNAVLSVTDTLEENLNLYKRVVAYGAMTFISERPQILFNANENKAGLSLIATTSIAFNDRYLSRMTGAFLAVTANLQVAERSCLLIRESGMDHEAMVADSGIFTRDEIGAKHPKHASAFNDLARLPPLRVFSDPMLSYLRRTKPAAD